MKLLQTHCRLGDLNVPTEQLAAAGLPVRHVHIVENQSGLAFQDSPGSGVFMRLGYGVTQLARIPWVAAANAFTRVTLTPMGSLFPISRGSRLPRVDALLMDEEALLGYLHLRSNSLSWARQSTLPFDALKSPRWGDRVRLEQERLGWSDYLWPGPLDYPRV
jgi:hypothetical protein